ncbi:hypothetical protein BC827DRAFT_195978 [Russula dissimulans]|nr:hypothetical protein BC827DRAFT_195978 [Russula dissimulans]
MYGQATPTPRGLGIFCSSLPNSPASYCRAYFEPFRVITQRETIHRNRLSSLSFCMHFRMPRLEDPRNLANLSLEFERSAILASLAEKMILCLETRFMEVLLSILLTPVAVANVSLLNNIRTYTAYSQWYVLVVEIDSLVDHHLSYTHDKSDEIRVWITTSIPRALVLFPGRFKEPLSSSCLINARHGHSGRWYIRGRLSRSRKL